MYKRLPERKREMSVLNYYETELARLRAEGNMRSIPADTRGDKTLVDLSSNDYLGLASKPELQAEFFASSERRGIPMTSSASRLLSPSQDEYLALEELLSKLYRRMCLPFNSGYHANTGMIQALASGKCLIVADKLVHASIIDGIILSKAPFIRFRHNDTAHLERILAKEAPAYDRIIILAESVYSMDGDRADIGELIRIKKAHGNTLLYIDEAHGFGVEGPKGLGICAAERNSEDVDVIVGTFGKACASMGAFCAVSPAIRDFLLNRARSFIFSTALPPMNAAWTRFMIEKIVTMDAERESLKALGARMHAILQPLSPDFNITPSHIQPLVVGSAQLAVKLSQKLREEGFKVLPIRTPTVPPGTERLRISLSAAISPCEIDRFGDALTRLLPSI